MVTRRFLLQTGTSSLVILGGAGLAGCNSDPVRTRAWRSLDNAYDDPRLDVLARAILAPSPHNRQPWRLALTGQQEITLYPDLERMLPQTDPENRQIMLGLGAFIAAADLAARRLGRVMDVEYLPQGQDATKLDGRPVARMVLRDDSAERRDPLVDYLPSRRTHRMPFRDRAVSDDHLSQIGSASRHTRWHSTSEMALVEALRSVALEAWDVEIRLPRTHAESVALTRIGGAEIDAAPDGISISGAAISLAASAGILTRDKMKDPKSRAFQMTYDFYADAIDASPSFGWLISEDNGRMSQIKAGRDWMRIHLAATEAGVAMQPLSQSLQEFPEMREQFLAVHSLLEATGQERVQGLFRLGYAKAPGPSPRWPLESRIVEA